MKISKTMAKIIIYCKSPRRPIDVWKHWENELSYTHICAVLSQLFHLGLLVKRNMRGKGINRTYYTSTKEAYLMALEVLK